MCGQFYYEFTTAVLPASFSRSCQIPFVASKQYVTEWILTDWPLYRSGSVGEGRTGYKVKGSNLKPLRVFAGSFVLPSLGGGWMVFHSVGERAPCCCPTQQGLGPQRPRQALNTWKCIVVVTVSLWCNFLPRDQVKKTLSQSRFSSLANCNCVRHGSQNKAETELKKTPHRSRSCMQFCQETFLTSVNLFIVCNNAGSSFEYLVAVCMCMELIYYLTVANTRESWCGLRWGRTYNALVNTVSHWPIISPSGLCGEAGGFWGKMRTRRKQFIVPRSEAW